MALRQVERASNHTPEQVHDYLAQALVIADDFDLTPAERAALLPTLVDRLAEAQIMYERVGVEVGLAGIAGLPGH